MHLPVKAFVLLCYVLSVTALSTFISPALEDTINVHVGDQVPLSWTQDWSSSAMISLIVYQLNLTGSWYHTVLLTNNTDPGRYTWSAGPIDDIPASVDLHFQVKRTDFGAYDYEWINSGSVFLETSNSSTATTTSLVTSAATSGSISMPTTANATSSSTLDGDKGLSSAAKVGLGVGLGVGIPFLVLVLAIATYTYRLHVKAAAGKKPVGHSQRHCDKAELADNTASSQPGQYPALRPQHELSDEARQNYELP